MNPVYPLSLSALIAVAVRVNAAEWPMFRGEPGLRGISGEVLSDSPKLLWSFKTGGPIKSSVAIAQGVAVFGSDDANIYALNAKTGEPLWTFNAEGAVEASPLILEDHVYIGTSEGAFYKLKLRDGTRVWTYTCGAQIASAANWARVDHETSPRILFGSYDFSIHCLDAESGTNLWKYPTDNYINGAAAIYEGVTVAGGCDGLLHIVDIKTGEQRRAVEIGAYIAGSPVLDGHHAYAGHYGNGVICVDFETGAKVWTYESAEQPFFSSPALTSALVIIGGRDKSVHALNRKDGKPAWTFRTNGRVDSSPVVADKRVFVGSDDGFLYMLDCQNGTRVWSYELGSPLTASPAISDGVIYIGSQDGVLFAFGALHSKE